RRNTPARLCSPVEPYPARSRRSAIVAIAHLLRVQRVVSPVWDRCQGSWVRRNLLIRGEKICIGISGGDNVPGTAVDQRSRWVPAPGSAVRTRGGTQPFFSKVETTAESILSTRSTAARTRTVPRQPVMRTPRAPDGWRSRRPDPPRWWEVRSAAETGARRTGSGRAHRNAPHAGDRPRR